jgi:hypothetical protein
MAELRLFKQSGLGIDYSYMNHSSSPKLDDSVLK